MAEADLHFKIHKKFANIVGFPLLGNSVVVQDNGKTILKILIIDRRDLRTEPCPIDSKQDVNCLCYNVDYPADNLMERLQTDLSIIKEAVKIYQKVVTTTIKLGKFYEMKWTISEEDDANFVFYCRLLDQPFTFSTTENGSTKIHGFVKMCSAILDRNKAIVSLPDHPSANLFLKIQKEFQDIVGFPLLGNCRRTFFMGAPHLNILIIRNPEITIERCHPCRNNSCLTIELMICRDDPLMVGTMRYLTTHLSGIKRAVEAYSRVKEKVNELSWVISINKSIVEIKSLLLAESLICEWSIYDKLSTFTDMCRRILQLQN